MTSLYHKHILYIGPEYRNHRGGIGAVLEVYAKHIKPFNFIATHRSGNSRKKALTFISAIFRLLYTLTFNRNIKIVHIHAASKASFLRKSFIVLICKIYRKKVVYHLHGGKFHVFYREAGKMRRYVRYILESCDMVVCLSEQWKKFLESTFRLQRLAVLNNVIDPAAAHELVIRENNKVNLLFLGLITRRKGIFDLLDILKNNAEALNGRVNLTIGGNGDIQRLEQSIKEFGNNEIRYVGWVNGEKKNELLKQCDVYILPSYVEGLPMSILEAMSYGKPIISTPVGGIPEIVKPGVNGWLFEPGDHAALTKIIFELLNQKEKLEYYGMNSLMLSKDYLPESVFNSLDMLYGQLIHGDTRKQLKKTRGRSVYARFSSHN